VDDLLRGPPLHRGVFGGYAAEDRGNDFVQRLNAII
jgi:hypothetical protein